MSTNNDNAAAAVIAFVSGAVIGVAAALLLAPAPGREIRGKLSDLGETAADTHEATCPRSQVQGVSKNQGCRL